MVANGIRNARNNSIARTFTENEHVDTPADFEKAITATGFGTYNIVLLLAAVPAGWASAFDMTTAAFFITSAECDLELTFIRNGILVSFVYIGMIVSSFFWGFVTDNVSRKPLIILGLMADACCNILSSVVDSYHIFLLLKFITGTIISGPLSLLVPYLAEFQSITYRAKFISWTGFIFAIGNVIPAILAFAILPLPWSFNLFDRVFVAWRIYILVCSIPSIVGIVTMCFLPESPKRLMANGKSDKALELMKRMYTINTHKSAETFPIKTLIAESKQTSEKNQTNYERISESWNNLKILLIPPYRNQFFITIFLQFGSMLGFNTMRLWLPHVFTIMNNFDYTLWKPSLAKPTLCEMVVPAFVPPGLDDSTLYANITNTCIRWRIESFIYMNSTVIATSAVAFSFFIVMFLDTRITKKFVLLSSFIIGTICTFGANWGQVVPIMLILCSTTIATSRIASNIIVTSDSVIPLSIRVTATSVITITGSLGTVVGNLVFSALLGTECIAAFMWLGCSLLLCAIVSIFALKSSSSLPDVELSEEPKIITRF